MSEQEQPQVHEKDVILNSAKGLLDIGLSLKEVNGTISDMCIFLSDRVLTIGEEKGYHLQQEQEQDGNVCTCGRPDCPDNQKSSTSEHPKGSLTEDISVIENQQPVQCVGHSNIPGSVPKPDANVQMEVKDLVEKIRSESSNAQ